MLVPSRRSAVAGTRRRIWWWTGGIALAILAVAALFIPRSTATGVNADNASHAPSLAGSTAAKPLKILVIGGTSGIGLETVKLALARGHWVTSMARHAPAAPIVHDHLKYIQGSIINAAQVSVAVSGQDVVVTTISIPVSRKPVRVFSLGASNVLFAMNSAGVKRLVAVTGIGAGDSRGHGGFAYDYILQPLILGSMYADKDLEEAMIRASAVDWTIVRPASLTDETPKLQYWVVKDLGGVTAGRIARADVAHYIVAAIESGQDLRTAVLLTD